MEEREMEEREMRGRWRESGGGVETGERWIGQKREMEGSETHRPVGTETILVVCTHTHPHAHKI